MRTLRSASRSSLLTRIPSLGTSPSIRTQRLRAGSAGPLCHDRGLVNELAEAADERTLSRVVARYGRLDLLLLDELNYVHLDPRGAELLFQVLTEREERASVAVAPTRRSVNGVRPSPMPGSPRPSSIV